MSPGLKGPTEAGSGQTEQLRRQGQSSFNVLMRGSPDARGIRGALCDAGFPGMAGVSVPPWMLLQPGGHCAFREGPVLHR